MNQCSDIILRWEDFEAMSKIKTQVNNFKCKIFEANWQKQNDAISFSVSANRFLRGMVRTLVGTMIAVGEGVLSVEDFESILMSKDRRKAGRSVPAHGLYLRNIVYPETIYLD